MNEYFDIPIALFMFKRSDTLLKIIAVLSKIKPKKLYLLSDQGRSEEEIRIV